MAVDEITKDTIKGSAIRELQGLSERVVAGAASATDIAVAGVTLEKSTLVSVLEYDPDGRGAGVGQINDRTSEAAITSDGNVQLDTTNTTGHDLIVKFFNKA